MSSRELDWSRPEIIARRDRFYAASQKSFMPYAQPLVFSRGKGQFLWDETGKRYIDLLGMNVCISVGHAHPVVNAAVQAQIEQLQHCTTMFSHPVPAHYAEELVARLPHGPDWVVHFTSSGAEAIDLALVMAQTYTRNIDMLALRNAYHGATLGAQSLTGIAAFRHHVPLLPGIHHIANPDPYRGIFGADTQAYLDEIDSTLRYATPGRLAGLLVEPIQGYGGIVELPPGYLKAASDKVRQAGGILIVDEVQCTEAASPRPAGSPSGPAQARQRAGLRHHASRGLVAAPRHLHQDGDPPAGRRGPRERHGESRAVAAAESAPPRTRHPRPRCAGDARRTVAVRDERARPAGLDQQLRLGGAGEPAEQQRRAAAGRAQGQHLTDVRVRRARLGVQVVAVVPDDEQAEVGDRGERRGAGADARPARRRGGPAPPPVALGRARGRR